MTSKWRRNDVDATSLRRIDVVTTSCACWEFAPPPTLPPNTLNLVPPQYSKPSYAYVISVDLAQYETIVLSVQFRVRVV